MNIGDKVRAVHGREEGVVVGLLPKGIVEVMLPDGFKIPFVKSDLVVVSVLEEKLFAQEKTESNNFASTKPQSFADKGFFLAKSHETDGKHVFHLVNNTDFQVLFTSFLLRPSTEAKPLAFGTMNKKTTFPVFKIEQTGILEESKMLIQLLFFAHSRSEVREPLSIEVALKPVKWKSEPETLPILEHKGTKIQLDIILKETDAHILTNRLSEKANTISGSNKPQKIDPELDLHIEKLAPDYFALKPDEILRYQLRAFENHLEKAISIGVKEVTYIHGIGNGILKAEIIKKLSANIFIKHFEDGRRDKYGYGATKVVLK